MSTLVLDCSSGISGDMTAAALLDLGADEKKLREVLSSLSDQQFELTVSRVKKSALDCCDFDVKLNNGEPHNDHDMAYLFGQESENPHHHHDGDDHEHEHTHTHVHEDASEDQAHHHSHHHEHRHLADVNLIIEQSTASDRAKALAKKIFQIIAEAEALSHGVEISQVHFHEVGALDSIVDILSVAVLLDDLHVTEVIVPHLAEGHGEIRCQHGILPIPVPAVMHIASTYGLTLSPVPIHGELITPTGAAIVAALKTSETLPKQYKIKKCGFGAGKRAYERPSILRAMLIEPVADENITDSDEVIKLETNIDDSTPESLGYLLERLYAEGALEAWFTPIFMKKNRPAYLLSVLTHAGLRERLETIIFTESTTIGIRRSLLKRTTLPRTVQKLATKHGDIEVKVCVKPDGSKVCYPEYESLKAVAQATGLTFNSVYFEALEAYREQENQ